MTLTVGLMVVAEAAPKAPDRRDAALDMAAPATAPLASPFPGAITTSEPMSLRGGDDAWLALAATDKVGATRSLAVTPAPIAISASCGTTKVGEVTTVKAVVDVSELSPIGMRRPPLE